MRLVSSLAAVFLGLCATAVVAQEPQVVGYYESPNGTLSPFPVAVQDGQCSDFKTWIKAADIPQGYDCVFYSQLECSGRMTDHYTEKVSRFKFEVRSFVCKPVSEPTQPNPTPTATPSPSS
ncbi:hypothetical protein TMEN_5685 [Trichophyton mentagrophytes]|uniref:Uncharacterized protein n=1 Tax=Trichophyton interdigitale (strain MR816) TaxID=1215338 RepID=A0A059J6G0_TRIIM|nr:hypothetical protein H101_02914 [Trichophyton interdigitale H6]KDB23466.1 hypothetical protein H109_04645 [Trichophyton interdigitale MR816]GBF63064.1 hypothetical protein TMEN_5685 [Trichophyton mentagrophytes]